jgi:hypothetical protein
MKSLDLGRYALSICIAVAMLAGCGGSQPPIWTPGAVSNSADGADNPITRRLTPSTLKSPARSEETPEYKVSGPLLYVTNLDSPPFDGVTIYDAKMNTPIPIAIINADIFQPGGDCIDAAGTLYVANNTGSSTGWVSEYALGKTKPLRLITKGISSPAFCAIDDGGNLWVTNSGGPTVTEYLKGSTDPHFTLKDGLTAPDGIAIDHARNIYVGNLLPYGTSSVQVYPPGSKSPSRTITDGLKWPVGIAVDANGTLYVTNDISPCNIEKYRAGQSHPYQEITKGIDGPTAVTFAPGDRMYEVNEGEQSCVNNGPEPVILEFRPDSLSPSKRMISNNLHVPVGAAYFPPLLP